MIGFVHSVLSRSMQKGPTLWNCVTLVLDSQSHHYICLWQLFIYDPAAEQVVSKHDIGLQLFGIFTLILEAGKRPTIN